MPFGIGGTARRPFPTDSIEHLRMIVGAILESPLRNIHHRTQKNRSHPWERRPWSLLFVESCDRLGAVLPVTVGGSPVLGGNLLCPRIERRGGDRYGYMDRALCLRYVSHRADLSDRSDH